MSVGGATWDTAGTLELGSGNTFTVADATEDEGPITELGWWTFTPAASAIVRISMADSDIVFPRLYTGASYAEKVFVDDDEFTDPVWVYRVQAGTTYHLLVGTLTGETPPVTYQVTYAQTLLAVSPWLSHLRDRIDNVLIISGPNADGDLQALNEPAFQVPLGWYASVIDGVNPPGRVGEYDAIEDFGGPPVSSAAGCIWLHARNGDQGGTGAWNGLCPSLSGGTADLSGNAYASYSLFAEDSDGPIGDAALAVVAFGARALYFLPVRDNLGPNGVLGRTAEEDGYPSGSTIQWETPYVELVKVELTGDQPSRPEAGTVLNGGVRFDARDTVAPLGGGTTWDAWNKGLPGFWNGDHDQHISTAYADGEPEWTELTAVASGDDGWDQVASRADAGIPDETVTIGMDAIWFDAPSSSESSGSIADVALRFTLRSPRYRWLYEQTTVVRQWPRDDVRGTSSAPRLWPPPKTRRIAGGYPGGSGL